MGNRLIKRRGNRNKLLSLFDRFKGKCVYCKCQTQLPKPGVNRQILSDNAATIEHIYTAHDLRRYTKEGWHKVKLACNKCNRAKGAIDKIPFMWNEDPYFKLIEFIK